MPRVLPGHREMPLAAPVLTVFVTSTADLGPERAQAVEHARTLGRRYRDRRDLKPFAYAAEHRYAAAASGASRAAIDKVLGRAELVVILFGDTLGMPLPADFTTTETRPYVVCADRGAIVLVHNQAVTEHGAPKQFDRGILLGQRKPRQPVSLWDLCDGTAVNGVRRLSYPAAEFHARLLDKVE